MNPFARDDVFPSWFVNSVQRLLSLAAFNFAVTKQDATHIHVEAGADPLAAAVSIQGRWRWNEATVSRAHPGGAAGTYDIFAVSKANKIDTSPAPGTDDTDYSFELRIVEAAHTPPIEAGVVDIFRKVGSLQWSGTEITRVDQTVPLAPTHAHRHATGQPDAIAPADIGAASSAEARAFRLFAKQPGVINGMRANGCTINGGTGKVTVGGTTGDGVVWIESGGALVYTASTFAGIGATPLTPPSLPAAGKYMSVSVQLAVGAGAGAEAVASLVCGVEKATEAEALAAPAALVGGRARLVDLIVKNTAGVYSIVAQRDRRPWAAGAKALSRLSAAGELKPTGEWIGLLAALEGPIRLECSGAPVRIRASTALNVEDAAKGDSSADIRVLSDGAELGGSASIRLTGGTPERWHIPIVFDWIFSTVTAGSHLFDLQIRAAFATGTHRAEDSGIFSVEELVSWPNERNG